MNYFWDILALALVISAMISCYKKGFMYSAVKTVGSIVSLVASVMLSMPVAKSVYDSLFRRRLTEGFRKFFASLGEIDLFQFEEVVNDTLENLPGHLGEKMAPAFSEYIDNWFQSFAHADFDSFADTFTRAVAEPVVVGFLRCICFLLLFFILSFAVKFIASMFKGVKYIPVLGSLNSILGCALGVLQGGIHVIMLCAVLWVILSFTSGIDGIITTEILSQTHILKLVFNVFPILSGIVTQL